MTCHTDEKECPLMGIITSALEHLTRENPRTRYVIIAIDPEDDTHRTIGAAGVPRSAVSQVLREEASVMDAYTTAKRAEH